MPQLNLDTAFVLDITGVYEKNSFKIELLRYEDVAQTIPENWANVNYEFAVSEKESGDPKIISLTDVVVDANKLTITCPADINIMTGKKKIYFWDLVADLTGGITRVEGKGKIECGYSVAR